MGLLTFIILFTTLQADARWCPTFKSQKKYQHCGAMITEVQCEGESGVSRGSENSEVFVQVPVKQTGEAECCCKSLSPMAIKEESKCNASVNSLSIETTVGLRKQLCWPSLGYQSGSSTNNKYPNSKKFHHAKTLLQTAQNHSSRKALGTQETQH